MSTFKFNDSIKFVLPPGFKCVRDEDENGEYVDIMTGKYIDDDGETQYEFKCNVRLFEHDSVTSEEGITVDTFLDRLLENPFDVRFIKFPGTPKMILANKAFKPFSVFGMVFKHYASIALIQVEDRAVMQLVSFGPYDDYNLDGNSERNNTFFKVLKAVRVNDEKLPIDGINLSDLEEVFHLTFEESADKTEVALSSLQSIIEYSDDTKEDSTPGKPNTSAEREDLVKEKSLGIDFSKFKGIHQVKNKPERVWINNTWSVEIPEGFTYSINPEASGSETTSEWLLYVQDSRDCDFDEPFSSGFNFIVFQKKILLHQVFDDVNSPGLMDMFRNISDGRSISKPSGNLLVYYNAREESKEFTSYLFYVAIRGTNMIYMGEIRLFDGTIAERKATIHRWLTSIDTLSQEEILSFRDYSNTSKRSIPVQFSTDTAPIDDGIRIGIPKGFHYETDPELIEVPRRLIIVPDDYLQYDDPMEAPVGLSVQADVLENISTDIQKAGAYFKFLCSLGKFFSESAQVFLNRHSYRAFSLSQMLLSEKSIKTITALFANDKSYILFMAINYWEKDFDSVIAAWDIEHFLRAWLGRIQIEGEPSPYELIQKSNTLDGEGQNNGLSGQLEETTSPNKTTDASLFDFTKNAKNEVTITKYKGHDKIVVIPETLDGGTVKQLGKESFKSNYDLQEVVMPDCITVVRGGVFANCTHLKKIHLSENLSTFPKTTFAKCTDLEEVNIPDRMLELKAGVFNDARLKKLHIGRSLIRIEKGAFYEKTPKAGSSSNVAVHDIKEITIDPLNNSLKVVDSMILSSDGKDLIIWLGGDQTFTIPEGIETIKQGAFSKQVHLKEVFFPDSLKAIERDAFDGTSLRDICLPPGLKSIGFSAFGDCPELTSVTFNEGLETIEGYAYHNAPVPAVNLPSTLKELGKESFIKFQSYGNTGFEQQVNIDPRNPYLQSDGSAIYSRDDEGGMILRFLYDPVFTSEYNSETSDKYENHVYEIAEGTTGIDSGACSFCYGLLSARIPDSVKYIGNDAFQFSHLESIDIPNGLEVIGRDAFAFCRNMKSITLPYGLKTIGEGAFKECSSLTDIIKPEEISDSHFADTPWFLNRNTQTSITPETPNNAETSSIVQPKNTEDQTVESIDNSKIKTVEESVKSNFVIQEGVLKEYSGTDTKVIVPNDVEVIGHSAFKDCDSLTNIWLPDGLKRIDPFAFSGCSNLSNVRLPIGLKVITACAFRYCSRLESIRLPEGLEIIGFNAFRDCSRLRNIVFPDTLTSIEENAFNGCSSLTSITLPEGVQRIGRNAFRDCGSLTNATLPDSLISLDSSAFDGCDNLTVSKLPKKNADEYIAEAEKQIENVTRNLRTPDLQEKNEEKKSSKRLKVIIIIAIVIVLACIAAVVGSGVINQNQSELPETTVSEDEEKVSDNEVETESVGGERTLTTKGYGEITSEELNDGLLEVFNEKFQNVVTSKGMFSQYGRMYYGIDETWVVVSTQRQTEPYDWDSPIDFCVIYSPTGEIGVDCAALIVHYLFNTLEYEEIKTSIEGLLKQSEENYSEEMNMPVYGNPYPEGILYCSAEPQEEMNTIMMLPPDIDIKNVLSWLDYDVDYFD